MHRCCSYQRAFEHWVSLVSDVVNIDRLLGSERGTVSHDRPLLVSIGDRAICGRDRFHHRSVAIIARSAAARVTKQISHAGVGWNGEIFLCCHGHGSDCPYWDILVRSNSPLDDDAMWNGPMIWSFLLEHDLRAATFSRLLREKTARGRPAIPRRSSVGRHP